MRLKRWESPRKQGRNDKGRGGSARKRQIKKQQQMLRNKLKEQQKPENNQKNQKNNQPREGITTFPLFLPQIPQIPDFLEMSGIFYSHLLRNRKFFGNFLEKTLDKTYGVTAILFRVKAVGRSQAVRQRVLVPPSLGSNPSAPVLSNNYQG